MIARRIWWATLPYWGWIGWDDDDGGVPAPWYAHPLSWIHRAVDWWLRVRGKDMFGPEHRSFSYVYPEKPPPPWQ